MNKLSISELSQRITQLEQLAWSLFRALETYITFSEPAEDGETHESDEDAVKNKR